MSVVVDCLDRKESKAARTDCPLSPQWGQCSFIVPGVGYVSFSPGKSPLSRVFHREAIWMQKASFCTGTTVSLFHGEVT